MAPSPPRKAAASRKLVEQICTLSGASFSELVQSSEERLGGKDRVICLRVQPCARCMAGLIRSPCSQGLQETLEWVDANLATLETLPWSYQHKS